MVHPGYLLLPEEGDSFDDLQLAGSSEYWDSRPLSMHLDVREPGWEGRGS